MLTITESVMLGALQGVTELFPISSLGHSVIIPAILGWNINEQDPRFLTFLVATHFATALVLFVLFWRDWKRIIGGIIRSLTTRRLRGADVYARLGWLLVIGTIPAGLLGLIFQKKIQDVLLAPQVAAIALMLNGVVLIVAEILRTRRTPHVSQSDARIANLSWGKGFGIGIAQTLALIPGFSRTGASLAGGLLAGLSHEDAVRFSFLLATPIIGAAAVLKLPSLLKPDSHDVLAASLAGAAAAAFCSFFAARFMMRHFKNERRSFIPFALYCFAAGLIAFVCLL